MADLQPTARTVYYAPTARRHFLTLRGAARREAGAMIARKYPTEHGDEYGGGFHWSNEDRLRAVHARLVRTILRRHAQRHGGG